MKKVKSVNPTRISAALEAEVIDGAPFPYSPDNPQSRAVARLIEPGEARACSYCDEPAKFKAKQKGQFLIEATVVDDDGKWERNEIFFPPSCYDEAGAPYGPVYTKSPQQGIQEGTLSPDDFVSLRQ